MLACPECNKTFDDPVARCPDDGCELTSIVPGTMLGEYRIERAIGRGTYGDVYRAEQPVIGKRVAIKVLRADLSQDAEAVARFTAEARAVNLVKSHRIVDIFSFGVTADGRRYFVMELLEGITLKDLLRREVRLAPESALPILRGVAEALDAAHDAGVLHRDLKPDNVFLVPDRDGTHAPKLLDFGVAKLMTEDMGIKTATGVALGTPRYMSPEQCRGKSVDRRADVYALGVVAHEMLTGHPPFRGGTPVDLLLKHAVEAPPPMSSVCPDLPVAMDAPVLAMLAKRPADRPHSAGRAIAALADAARATASSSTQRLGTIVMEHASPAPPPMAQRPADLRLSQAPTVRAEVPAALRKGDDSTATTSAVASLPITTVPGVPTGRRSAVLPVAIGLAVLLAGGVALVTSRGADSRPAPPAPAALPEPAPSATAHEAPEPRPEPASAATTSTTAVAVKENAPPPAVKPAPTSAARVKPPAPLPAPPHPAPPARAPAHDIGF